MLHTVCFSAESLAMKRPLIETLLLPCLPFSNIIANSVVEGLNFLVRSGFEDIVFCFKNCSVVVRKRKKILEIEKNILQICC